MEVTAQISKYLPDTETTLSALQDYFAESSICTLTSLVIDRRGGVAVALLAKNALSRLNQLGSSYLPKEFLERPIRKDSTFTNGFLLGVASYLSSLFVGREVARSVGYEGLSFSMLILGSIAFKVGEAAYSIYSFYQSVPSEEIFKKDTSIIQITAENFDEEILQSKIPVVLDAYAPWCMPCRIFAPILSEVSQELKGRVKIVKLNTQENPELTEALNVQTIPTLLYYNEGKLVDRVKGVLKKEKLISSIEENFHLENGIELQEAKPLLNSEEQVEVVA